MPIITLNFPNPLNVSVQIGDVAWFVSTLTNAIPPSTTAQGQMTEIGIVVGIGPSFLRVDAVGAVPAAGDFIMFAKDNQANMSSLLGYYARFRLQNDSYTTGPIPELFAVSAEYFESSK